MANSLCMHHGCGMFKMKCHSQLTLIVRQIEADILTISGDNSILVLSCSFKVSKYISECWPR